jgi:hypothetical protein
VTNPLPFFATPGPLTDLGGNADLLEGLPRDIETLCRVVQGLLIHIYWAKRYGLDVPPDRQAELQLRPVAPKLKRILELDPRPLTEPRDVDRKLVGNCRDFSLLLTAFLRHQAIPARARCGFGRYFLSGHYEDHWVCEYWNAAAGSWQLVDSQLDELQRRTLKVAFDPLDVPRDQFIVGGKAWQLCRSGQSDPDKFGIQEIHGLWFVRGDLVRDVAALNKVELLPWDGWGLADGRDEDLTAGDLSLLDHVAELTSADVPDWPALRRLYESEPHLRVPPSIRSYGRDGPRVVELHGIERA